MERNEHLKLITDAAIEEVVAQGWENCSSQALILSCFGMMAYNTTETLNNISKELCSIKDRIKETNIVVSSEVNNAKKYLRGFGWRLLLTVVPLLVSVILAIIFV